MNLIPLVDYLQAQGIGKEGKSLFVGLMPTEAGHKSVLLRNKLTGTPIDYELPGYYKTTIQVIVRATEYASGEVFAQQVASTLTLNEVNLGGMYIRYLRPTIKPVGYPLSAGGITEFNIAFEACYNEGD